MNSYPLKQPLYPSIPSQSSQPPKPAAAFPAVADPLTSVPATAKPSPVTAIPKPRRGTYQDVKLVLRDKPTTAYCHYCKRNVITNIQGRKKFLCYVLFCIPLTLGVCLAWLSLPCTNCVFLLSRRIPRGRVYHPHRFWNRRHCHWDHRGGSLPD